MRTMILLRALLTLVFATLATAADAKPVIRPAGPPCKNGESAPPPTRPQAELREGTLTFGSPSEVDASACVVLGAAAQQPPQGVRFNYNFALFAPGSKLLDANGTQAFSGPFDPHRTSVFSLPLSLSFPLPTGARIDSHLVLGQANIAPCDDRKCASPDVDNGYYVTTVMRPRTYGRAPRTEKMGPGCLDPVDFRQDPELRQVVVAGSSDSYSIYACMVSRRYVDFGNAQFTVSQLLDSSGTNHLDHPDGNTRLHIHPLVGGIGFEPRLVTLLGVTIKARDANVVPVKTAKIAVEYRGCADVAEQTCAAGSDTGKTYIVRYFNR